MPIDAPFGAAPDASRTEAVLHRARTKRFASPASLENFAKNYPARGLLETNWLIHDNRDF
jgi:hypothetical protein